jgi:hypothetical protein
MRTLATTLRVFITAPLARAQAAKASVGQEGHLRAARQPIVAQRGAARRRR